MLLNCPLCRCSQANKWHNSVLFLLLATTASALGNGIRSEDLPNEATTHLLGHNGVRNVSAPPLGMERVATEHGMGTKCVDEVSVS